MPDLSAPAGESDFYFVPAKDPETAIQRILEWVKTRIPKRFGLNPIRDFQVLHPMNRGGVGARSLKIELQAAGTPPANARSSVSDGPLRPATRSCRSRMTTKELYNGDIGYIVDVDPEGGELVARFDARSVNYGFGELDTLVPAAPPPSTRARAPSIPP